MSAVLKTWKCKNQRPKIIIEMIKNENIYILLQKCHYQDWRGLLCVPSEASALLLSLQWPPISPVSRKSSLYLQRHEKEKWRMRETAGTRSDRKFSQLCQTENNRFAFSLTSNNLTDLSWPLRGLRRSRYKFVALQNRMWLEHFREESPLGKKWKISKSHSRRLEINLYLHACA